MSAVVAEGRFRLARSWDSRYPPFPKVRVVENIKEITLQGELCAFGDLEALPDTEIKVYVGRTVESTAAQRTIAPVAVVDTEGALHWSKAPGSVPIGRIFAR